MLMPTMMAITLCANSATLEKAGSYCRCSEPSDAVRRLTTEITDQDSWPRTELEAQMPPKSLTRLADKLAETGGVLTPPESGRLIIIDPPATGPNSMAIEPDIGPRFDRDARISTDAKGLNAAC